MRERSSFAEDIKSQYGTVLPLKSENLEQLTDFHAIAPEADIAELSKPGSALESAFKPSF